MSGVPYWNSYLHDPTSDKWLKMNGRMKYCCWIFLNLGFFFSASARLHSIRTLSCAWLYIRRWFCVMEPIDPPFCHRVFDTLNWSAWSVHHDIRGWWAWLQVQQSVHLTTPAQQTWKRTPACFITLLPPLYVALQEPHLHLMHYKHHLCTNSAHIVLYPYSIYIIMNFFHFCHVGKDSSSARSPWHAHAWNAG